MSYRFESRPNLTVKIGGKEITFDAQTDGDLQEAKDWHFNNGFKKYLGSSMVYYANGVENKCSEMHHFFNR